MNSAYVPTMLEMPIFKGFTASGAQRLIDLGQVKEHAPGEQLCAEGDPATCVLLILTGKLRVYIERAGSELLLADFGPGSILGEIAVLCGTPRAASVRATEQSAVLYWTDEAFRTLILGDVFLSHRIFSCSLRSLIEREKSRIERLTRRQASVHTA